MSGFKSVLSTGFGFFVALVPWTLSAAEPATITNSLLTATYDEQEGNLAVNRVSGGALFRRSVLSGERGTVQVVPVTDPHWGAGQSLQITYAEGQQDIVSLYPDLPFVLLQSRLCNRGTTDQWVEYVRLFEGQLPIHKDVLSDWRALGTAGLTEVDKHSGSYAYLAIADKAMGDGFVGGWLTHDRGSGVVFSSVSDGIARITARLDYGRLRIQPGKEVLTEVFALGYFGGARLGLEAYADAIAKHYAIKLPAQPAGYCTWYADKFGGACDEQHLAELAQFAAEKLGPFGFTFVQIDDGWQAGISKDGPCRNFTTHKPGGPYPAGMKSMASQISAQGLMPGIWFMPFAGTSYDPFFQEHQDWFAKDANGKPFEATWGGTCLDMTHPGAREHLRSTVHRIARDWGFRFFKMDGLWTGTATRLMYVNDGYQDDHFGESVLSDPDKTPIEAYRDGLRLVRETAGPDVYLLGCCVSQNMRSFGGAFGLLDAMRIGPDTGAGHIGAPHGSRNYFLHGRVWHNDPDCVSVRSSTSLDQARLNATFTAISGQLFYNSDWLPDLPPERLDILRRTMPAHGLFARPLDLFESEPARIWHLVDTREAVRRDVVAVYNWDESRSAVVNVTSSRSLLGLPEAAGEEYVAYDFWAQRFVRPFVAELSVELPPASCRVLAIRPVSKQPQLLSTSRHVTQGIVDVRGEQWDAAARSLSATSAVVASDHYELRIVVPVGPSSWRVREIQVSDEDVSAGVRTEFQQDGPKVRVQIHSETSREVRWSVAFESGAVELPPAKQVTDLVAVADYDGVRLTWQDAGSEGFRIERSDGVKLEWLVPEFVDTSVRPGEHYTYSVTALNWDGSASVPMRCEVTVPDELKIPPAPPIPAVRLESLQPVKAEQAWGALGINKSVEGKPLTVNVTPYEHGLGTHACALLVYTIPENAKRFVAVVGLDDEKQDDPRSSVTFEVYGDVQEMGEKPVLLAQSPRLCAKTVRAWTFDIELGARYKELRLVVTDAGDGIAADHADWVDAGFLK